MFGIAAFAEAPFASLSGQTVVVALTGVQASGAVGTVVSSQVFSAAITGVAATGAVGTVGANCTVALTGVQAAGQVGTVGTFYWSLIDDSETPNWQLLDDSQTPNWQNVAMTV